MLKWAFIEAAHSKQQQGPHQGPPQIPKTQHLSIKPPELELYLGASVFYLDLFCTLISEMCPEVLEKPKRGNLGGLRMLKNFPYELVEVLYTIST